MAWSTHESRIHNMQKNDKFQLGWAKHFKNSAPKKEASLLETAGVMNSLHLRAVRVRFCALISQQWKGPSRLSPGEKISQDKARQKWHMSKNGAIQKLCRRAAAAAAASAQIVYIVCKAFKMVTRPLIILILPKCEWQLSVLKQSLTSNTPPTFTVTDRQIHIEICEGRWKHINHTIFFGFYRVSLKVGYLVSNYIFFIWSYPQKYEPNQFVKVVERI